MRKIVMAVGLVVTVLLAGCDWGGTPPIPVVQITDDAIDNTLATAQVVAPKLTFEQHLRFVGTVTQAPGVFDVFHVDLPADDDYRLAFDCTATANLEVNVFTDQQAPVLPARTCGPGHLTDVVSGSGFFLMINNNTLGSIEASYDLTLRLVAVAEGLVPAPR